MITDRQKVVDICNKVLDNTLDSLDIIVILQAYCEDRCASMPEYNWEDVRNKIEQCISIVISNGTWKTYFNKALEYFKIKYAICELYSEEVEQKTPFGVTRGRKLLKIY